MTDDPDLELRFARRSIDILDAEILRLIRNRLNLVAVATRAKKRLKKRIHDPAREASLLAKAETGPDRDVYRALVEACREAAFSGDLDERFVLRSPKRPS